MAEILKVRQGETITLPGVFTDKDGKLVDPSVTQRIRIANPTRTLVALSGSATVDDMETDGVTGEWKYDYDVAANAPVGEWPYQVEGKDSADNHIAFGEGVFEVEPAFPADTSG